MASGTDHGTSFVLVADGARRTTQSSPSSRDTEITMRSLLGTRAARLTVHRSAALARSPAPRPPATAETCPPTHQRLLQHPRVRPQARRTERRHQLRLHRHQRQLVLALRRRHLDRRLRPRHRPPRPARRGLGLRERLDHRPAQAFANDVTRSAAHRRHGQRQPSKSDQDPAEWIAVRLACTAARYVRAWVQVKYYYDLSVDSAEKSALIATQLAARSADAVPSRAIRPARRSATADAAEPPRVPPSFRTVRGDGGG